MFTYFIHLTFCFWVHRMGCALHGHGHAHGGHGHSHAVHPGKEHSHGGIEAQPSTVTLPRVRDNMNVRAALIHVISDFVQSCGVFLAALVIFFYPEWTIVDPICTFLFSILVLFTTLNIMKDAVLVSFHEKLITFRIDTQSLPSHHVDD